MSLLTNGKRFTLTLWGQEHNIEAETLDDAIKTVLSKTYGVDWGRISISEHKGLYHAQWGNEGIFVSVKEQS